MARDRYSYSYAQASGRPWVQRAWMVLLVATGITLLVLGRSQHVAVTNIRAQLLDGVSPVLSVLSQPVASVQGLVQDKRDLFRAFEENKNLRTENDNLRHWQAVAQALKAENESLRALAEYKPVGQVRYDTARVIGQSPSAYAGTLTINAGASHGLKALQPVIDNFGLVGRVTDVGDDTARVLLLSDSSSRVPVITGGSRHHAILAGTGEELLRLTFIGGDAKDIDLGEQVVTTEEGGLIPGGIAVGTVFRREGDMLLVKPTRPLAQSEFVRAILIQTHLPAAAVTATP